jgi:hypothetical protein
MGRGAWEAEGGFRLNGIILEDNTHFSGSNFDGKIEFLLHTNQAASWGDIPLSLCLGFQDKISNREFYFENLQTKLVLFRNVIVLDSQNTSKHISVFYQKIQSF